MGRWTEGPLVGRDEVMAELGARAASAASGTGSIVLLTGPAGVGKTSVARALADAVGEQPTITFGVCVADQSAPPFWPWRPLVDPEAIRAREIDQAVGATRVELLGSLRDQVGAAVRDGPRVHVLEDLQWADVASVLLLGHLEGTVADLPLLVIATLRTGEALSPALDAAMAELRRSVRVIELDELTEGDVAALVGAAGIEPEPRLLDVLHFRTTGNPLFLVELLRAIPARELAERRFDALADRVPARVSDLVSHRLHQVPPPVADLLRTASVLGIDGDVAILAAVHVAPAADVVDLLEQARAVDLLAAADPGRWQFRHGVVRDAVYDLVVGSDRAQRHARAAEVLEADPQSPTQAIAHHALAARPLFDGDRAADLAARAGEAAFEDHAYEEAVTWSGRALGAASAALSDRWRAELLVRRGEAQRHIGEVSAARESFLQAAALSDDADLLARAALGYASPGADLGIAYRTEGQQTVELLERAIAAQPEQDTRVVVLLEARLASELYFSEEPERSPELARAALARAERLGDPHALAMAGAVVHDALVVGQAGLDEQLQGSTQLLDWARASRSTACLLTAHRARVLDDLAAGDLAGADEAVVAFARIAAPLRAPGYQWWVELWSAMRALLDGRHELAEARAVAAHDVGAAPFPSLALGNLVFLLFFLRREQGRLAELEQATRDYAAAQADIPSLRVALVFLLAEIGRLDEARGALVGFDADALARLHDRNWPASWFQLARAASLVGDRRLAKLLLEPSHRPGERCVQVSLGTVCLGSVDLAVAWLLEAVGDDVGAEAHYRSAEEDNARLGARSWLAQARHDHARLLQRRGRTEDREEAARLLDLACAAATDIGLATVDASPSTLATAAPLARATFRRDGSTWEVAFAERAVRLPDARGLRDLAYLLARPGEAVSVLELLDEPGADASSSRGAPALDDRARREIRERLRDLDQAEADAEADGDGEQAALVREERQELAEAVARDFGLGGRSRRVGDPVERARKTVSTRLRRTIAMVARAHPELGRHLERSVDTGAWCAYRPPEPVEWHS